MADKLWLWRNFVDGRPEYLAFDNPYPTLDGGDPMVIGEPCGYAIFMKSTPSPRNASSTDAEVIAAIQLARGYSQLERENADLAAKLARAQADAERYRWLREHGDDAIYVIRNWKQGDPFPPLKLAQSEELDLIIDAAISEAKEGKS